MLISQSGPLEVMMLASTLIQFKSMESTQEQKVEASMWSYCHQRAAQSSGLGALIRGVMLGPVVIW